MRFGFDVSNPGSHVFGGYDVAGGYLGGATPHIWQRSQWDVQPARYRSLFWVPDPAHHPKDEGQAILAALEDLHVPHDVIVWLDMETRVDPTLVNGVANEVHAGGWRSGVYGSESTVFGNPPRSGYMVAHYDGVARLYEHPHSVAKQYNNNHPTPEGVAVDLDVYADTVPLWDTRPQPVTIRPPWAAAVLDDLATVIADAAKAQAAIETNVK